MGDRVYYVYILASRIGGTLYVGVTSDLVQRVHQHRTKHAKGFTAKYGVTRLVYFEPFGGSRHSNPSGEATQAMEPLLESAADRRKEPELGRPLSINRPPLSLLDARLRGHDTLNLGEWMDQLA